MLAETVKEWMEQWVEEGLEQQRALLRRMTASRFGPDAAERLAGILEHIADPERVAEIGDMIVRCATAGELFARTDAAQDRETSA